ncbi:LacI family DNA-binding transcriptional regulator [Salinactinospora qingdaonensis]|uniref:LacI family DNA-binding transcriptional regulator n=1 Tax=Salinactinospora qingdaonensis TaxID=702744 RepID=A0ABP7F5Z3_9ACTN
MIDVAHLAGVSVKTVSRVVNHTPTVDAALTERVLEAIRELGFRRNDVAANLRSGRNTSTIGLVIEDLSNTFYSTIAAAVFEVSHRFNTQLITASSEETTSLEEEIVLDLCQRRVDGLIIVPTGNDQSYLQPEIDMGLPVVFVDRPPAGLNVDSVLIDNRKGARAAVEQLLSEGHRKIAVMVDSLHIYTMRERLIGAEEALCAAEVPPEDHIFEAWPHEPSDAAGVVAHLFDSPSPPTAVFCGNNRILMGAVAELVRRGEKTRVAGFDDFEFAGLLPHPVTVVGYDTPALGTLAAELLFRRIHGETLPPKHELLPTYLAERGIPPARRYG